jgi:hypothetical protein
MVEPENVALTFSDEDFERRYSSTDPAPADITSPAAAQTFKPAAAGQGRSRNRFMRTLLRRRLAASQSRR